MSAPIECWDSSVALFPSGRSADSLHESARGVVVAANPRICPDMLDIGPRGRNYFVAARAQEVPPAHVVMPCPAFFHFSAIVENQLHDIFGEENTLGADQ